VAIVETGAYATGFGKSAKLADGLRIVMLKREFCCIETRHCLTSDGDTPLVSGQPMALQSERQPPLQPSITQGRPFQRIHASMPMTSDARTPRHHRRRRLSVTSSRRLIARLILCVIQRFNNRLYRIEFSKSAGHTIYFFMLSSD
jgi:hypothetical protein